MSKRRRESRPKFRESPSRTQIGFRLTQEEADALAAAANGENQSPGAYARQAALEKAVGGQRQDLLLEIQALRSDVLATLQAHDRKLQELHAEFLAFRTDFLQALPET
jgi:hypothetical protein